MIVFVGYGPLDVPGYLLLAVDVTVTVSDSPTKLLLSDSTTIYPFSVSKVIGVGSEWLGANATVIS